MKRYLSFVIPYIIFLLHSLQKSFEMKVNVSGSEFVALQNVDVEDTDAVILRVSIEYVDNIDAWYMNILLTIYAWVLDDG